MDLGDLDSMSKDQLGEMLDSVEGVYKAIKSKLVEEDENQLVWFERPNGRRDVVTLGHWRNHMEKRPGQPGYRLLRPEEVEDQEAQVAQARAERAEKRRLWEDIPDHEKPKTHGQVDDEGWQNHSVEALERMLNNSAYRPAKDASREELEARLEEMAAKVDALTTPEPKEKKNKKKTKAD